MEGARGQRAHAERDLVRAREPRRDDAAAPRVVHALPGAPGRPLPGAAADRPLAGRADRRRGGGDGRRVDAGAVQLRLLRACVPGAADGGRAGRGVRPGRPRRGLLHAHHARAPARARDLPADRRRLHGPARVPARLGARRARPDARLPRGRRGDRQRGRHRRRRRQGGLPLRAGDDPLLPRRGADPRQRPDLSDDRRRAARVGDRPAGGDGGQADQRERRDGGLHRADGFRRGGGAPGGGADPAAGAVDRAGAGAAVDGPDRGGGRLAGAASRRPSPVRGVRRRHPHRPRRADAGGAARGLDDRQLVAGRRLEGHLGARRGSRHRR